MQVGGIAIDPQRKSIDSRTCLCRRMGGGVKCDICRKNFPWSATSDMPIYILGDDNPKFGKEFKDVRDILSRPIPKHPKGRQMNSKAYAPLPLGYQKKRKHSVYNQEVAI